MNENFLQPISDESDLTLYEDFINSSELKKQKHDTFADFLKSLVGKGVKIYMTVGDQLTVRQGKLLGVHNDYISLAQNREKLAIKSDEIKFISTL